MCAEAANDEELGLDRLDTKGSQSFVSCSQLSSVPPVAYFFSGGLYDTYMHIYIYLSIYLSIYLFIYILMHMYVYIYTLYDI